MIKAQYYCDKYRKKQEKGISNYFSMIYWDMRIKIIVMKILYMSTLCSEKEFDYLYSTAEARLNQQMQKYNQVLTSGFAQIDNVYIKAISARPVTMNTYKKRVFRKKVETEKQIEYIYLPFINIKLLKSLIILVSAVINGMKISKENENEKLAIICDVLNIPLSIASLILGKYLNIPVVGIVTDIPGYDSSDEGKINFWRKRYIKHHQILIQKNDCFVFLSQFMNSVINTHNKPFRIIEGQVDTRLININNLIQKKNKTMVMMYAGSIDKANGIDILTEAFMKSNINNTELHIYGSGSYSNELELLSKTSNKVKYFGSASNKIVVEREIEADILVNPRPTNREFVKYSFPSKIMEYMVSGTPVLTTKIPSMPEEYNNYIYFIEDESVEGLTKTINELLTFSREELFVMGQKARKFVLREKSGVVQAKKIIDLVSITKGKGNYEKKDSYNSSL